MDWKGFVNPYNFIGFQKEKAKAYTDEDVHTGVIEYSITTKTPLFIPNSSSETAFCESDEVAEHKSYDFFSYTELDGKKRYEKEYHIPVIPGSEMRGVVRNAYETLTDSCMGLLNEEEYPIKRSGEQFKPALIYRNSAGNYSLLEAKSLRIGEKAPSKKVPPGFSDYKNGDVIYYQEPPKNDKHQPCPIEDYSTKKNGYRKKGYLLKWGMGVEKARYHVFTAKANEAQRDVVRKIHLSKDIIERQLYRIIDSYLSVPAITSDNEAAYKEYRQDLEQFLGKKEEGYFPVNYSQPSENSPQIFYLSPATLTKEISTNSIGKLAGDFKPCRDEICPACDLFGYVGENNEVAKGSQIRFSDLYVQGEEKAENYYACNKLTIEALGEPKLGNIDFYLKRPAGASFWTYDYLIRPTIKDGKKTGELEIRDGVLRGRKFYWHHRKVNTSRSVMTTKLNKTIRPVKKDIVFTGKLYFESISKRQLDQLIWLLNSGNEKLGLKLGGAKPLGFGSISCQVQCVQERVIRLKNGNLNYELMELPVDGITYESAGFSSTVKKEFYKIAGLETIPENVEITYPKTIEQKGQPLTEGFKWFVNNHKTLSGGGMRGRNNVRIETVLPSILDEDVSMEYNLPSQTSRGGAKGFNGGSGKTSGNGRNRGNSQGNFRKNNQRGRH